MVNTTIGKHAGTGTYRVSALAADVKYDPSSRGWNKEEDTEVVWQLKYHAFLPSTSVI